MKFLIFSVFSQDKAAEIAQASDKVANTPGAKTSAMYVCQGIAFAGVPPNTLVTIAVVEAESNDAISARIYPLSLAGATVWAVPVQEMPVAGAVKTEKKFRGRGS
jgi:hypothetical protein